MTVGVYVLIGADDKPIYVGQSTNIDKRLMEHRSDKTRHEKLGGKTKGEVTHRVEVIECAREELDATEKRVIAERGPVLNVLHSMTDYAVKRRNVIRENQRRRSPVAPNPHPVDDLDAEIKRIVDLAPPLSPSQRDHLAALLAVDEPKPRRRGRSGAS